MASNEEQRQNGERRETSGPRNVGSKSAPHGEFATRMKNAIYETAEQLNAQRRSSEASSPAKAPAQNNAAVAVPESTAVAVSEEEYTVVDIDEALEAAETSPDESIVPSDQDTGALSHTDDPREIENRFAQGTLRVPNISSTCRGIRVKGRVIRTFVFSTDLAIIRNCDADAVLAVYPFTCQPTITQALLHYAERPVFTGVSGTKTRGFRSVELATFSEMQGASGVVVNRTSDCETVRSLTEAVDIPIVVTAYEMDDDTRAMIESGAHIVNVAAGRNTPEVVAQVRAAYPDMPIIASGGKDEDSMRATIEAGADALIWSPPSLHELERAMMAANRAMVASEQIATEPTIARDLPNEEESATMSDEGETPLENA